MDSKDYSWEWVTADKQVAAGPCELVYARSMTVTAEANTFIYNGTDTKGTPVVEFESGVNTGQEFAPPVPVFCNQGIYVDIGTNTIGVFVMWRNLW